MAITSQSKVVTLTSELLNLPTTSGISQDGYWFYYVPVNANNSALGAALKPYRWGDALSIAGGSANLVINGTLPLITESWEGANTKYHGSSIEWIGPGINDITATQEADAFFFGHLGSLSPSPTDDAFYWDRAYKDINNPEWYYYQYHKHLPTIYPAFENGRMTHSARGYINPSDKAFAYMINTRITVMTTVYSSVLARVHTPSIGGAHNSHNDVTLPSVSTRNYMPGGIIKGNSDRFHAFYMAANGANWDVYNRTYTQASLSFSAEVNLGAYDLADPTFNPVANTGTQSQYPVRASAGSVYNERIYFPILFNNVSSGYDLKIWSFNSLDTIAGGSLIQYTLASGVSVRPDCHLQVYNNVLYALYTDVTNGGIRLQSFNDTTGTWTDEGQVLTNSNTKFVRVHGFEYNPADVKFYALLSGTALGGGTYTGPGMYSFALTGTFSGYKHLDYDENTNSFVNRAALATGYLRYNQVDATITRVANTEPAGIPNSTNVLEYTIASPRFINRKEAILGGNEFYYAGINLTDGRKVLAGKISDNPSNFGSTNSGDLLVSVFLDTFDDPHHIAWGGAGDDYITSLYESKTSSKVWMTGYTKSSLVENKDIKIHGFCRNFADGANEMDIVGHVLDVNGNIYATGNHADGYINLYKFDSNYNLLWQTSFDNIAGTNVAYDIAIDSDNHVYIVGSTTAIGAGGTEGLLIKASSVGRLEYTRGYGTAGSEYISGIAIVTASGYTRLVLSSVSGTSTTFIETNTDGASQSQNVVSNLIVEKLRPDSVGAATGKFIFAGNDGAGTPVAKFGAGICGASPQIQWVSTYSDGVNTSLSYDIRNVSSNVYAIVGKTSTSGLVLKIQVVSNSIINKLWAKTIDTSTLFSTAINTAGDIFAVGYTTASGIASMGMDDSLIVKFDTSGTLVWQNVFGHDMDERLLSVELDANEENLISSGWSSSHSSSKDAVIFRSWTGGYGTGIYHIEGNPGVPYIYAKSSLSSASESSSLTVLSAPANSAGSLTVTGGVFTTFTGDAYTVTNSGTNNYIFNGGGFTDATDPTLTLARGGTYTFAMGFSGNHPFYIKSINTVGGSSGLYNSGVTNNGAIAGQTLTFAVPADAPDVLYYRCGNHSGMAGVINIVDNPSLSNDFTQSDKGFTVNKYDGSFGPDGVFMFWLGYLDLELLQEYLNSTTHRTNMANGVKVDYTDHMFKFYQVATVGDGTADDGNIFGYDVIEASDGTIWAIGTTSGDLSRTNLGASGVYDYVLIKFNPVTEEFSYYQNGTSLDEEAYALTELANGKIAFTGRTTGNLGSSNLGGYDVFLGIFDPTSDTATYYSTGTGLDDKGVDVHDLGSNNLAIAFTSYGALGPTNSGTEDIGVIKFNYSSNTWGTAYQTGSQTSDFVEQNGNPSIVLADGRIAIVCSSAGIFADDEQTYGYLDVCVAVLDTEGNWKKYQIGSGASDFASSVSTTGDRLIIAGYTRSTFADGNTNGILLEFDITNSVGAKAAVA